ncbi:MAG: hypothetical protein ACRC1H_19105 [Caldilineaceae bacterium]
MFYENMPLREIEFELTAHQFELMGYPELREGQPFEVLLDGGVLLPDAAAFAWFHVQPEPLTPALLRAAPAQYAIAGQIRAAELSKEGEGLEAQESAVLLVECDGLPIRVTCAPTADGMLPWGTWETRWLSGYTLLMGLAEDDLSSSIGETIGVTLWRFHRLVLTPGDPHFGRWIESHTLPAAPLRQDRIVVAARVHRRIV